MDQQNSNLNHGITDQNSGQVTGQMPTEGTHIAEHGRESAGVDESRHMELELEGAGELLTNPGANTAVGTTGLGPRPGTPRHPLRRQLLRSHSCGGNGAAPRTLSPSSNAGLKRTRRDSVPEASVADRQKEFERDRRGLEKSLIEMVVLMEDVRKELLAKGLSDVAEAMGELRETTRSCSRKWLRMSGVVNEVDATVGSLSEENGDLTRALALKDREISALKKELEGARQKRKYSPEEIFIELDKGVPESKWVEFAESQWPNEAFENTDTVSGAGALEGNLVIVFSTEEGQATEQLLQLEIPKAAKNILSAGNFVEPGGTATIRNVETVMAGTQVKTQETTIVMINVQLGSEDLELRRRRLMEAMLAAQREMGPTEVTLLTRLKGMNLQVRKYAELKARATGVRLKVMAAGKKKGGGLQTQARIPQGTQDSGAQQRESRQALRPQQQSQRTLREVERQPRPGRGFWPGPRQAGQVQVQSVQQPEGSYSREFPELARTRSKSGARVSKKLPPRRRPAVIIPAAGKSVPEMNRVVKQAVGDLVSLIVDARKTLDGRFVVETKSAIDAERLRQAFARAETGSQVSEPRLKLVISRLDGDATVEEVKELLAVGGVDALQVRIPTSGRSSKVAIVTAKDCSRVRDALASGTVRVGLGVHPIRLYVQEDRCFRCHESGHVQSSCKSATDLSKCCWKCRKEGHLARDCREEVLVAGSRDGPGSAPAAGEVQAQGMETSLEPPTAGGSGTGAL